MIKPMYLDVSAWFVAIPKSVGKPGQTTTTTTEPKSLERRLLLNSQCQDSCNTSTKNHIPAMVLLTSLLGGLLTFSEP
jgi:hypothetical protein